LARWSVAPVDPYSRFFLSQNISAGQLLRRFVLPVPGKLLTTAMAVMPHNDAAAALETALSMDIPFLIKKAST
jgi:hypothetical protein